MSTARNWPATTCPRPVRSDPTRPRKCIPARRITSKTAGCRRATAGRAPRARGCGFASARRCGDPAGPAQAGDQRPGDCPLPRAVAQDVYREAQGPEGPRARLFPLGRVRPVFRAAGPAGRRRRVQANATRPAGVQAWNSSMLATDTDLDWGDPNEPCRPSASRDPQRRLLRQAAAGLRRCAEEPEGVDQRSGRAGGGGHPGLGRGGALRRGRPSARRGGR